MFSLKNISTLFLIMILVGLCTNSAMALTTKEASSSEYLYDHGHSKEIGRLVEFQKDRVNGETPAKKKGLITRSYNYVIGIFEINRQTDKFGDRQIKDW